MATTGREARRRRILERGEDRLALITGRIQTLPSASSLPPESRHSDTPPTVGGDPLLSSQTPSPHPIVPHSTEDEASSFEFPHHDDSVESDTIGNNNGESRTEPILPNFATSTEALRASHGEENVSVQSSCAPPIVQAEDRVEPQVCCQKLFNPKQINSAIAATERTRIFCSVAVAVIVALSYAGFPILGDRFTENIVYSRPLYLVLITSMSIVLKRLFLDERGGQKAVRETTDVAPVAGYGSAEQLGQILELVFVFKNITDAVFTAFSVYAIVLICGLALAQELGL